MKSGSSLRRDAVCRMAIAWLLVCGQAGADGLPAAAANGTTEGRCASASKSPTLKAIRAISLPESAWLAAAPVKVDLHFRVDASGHPVDVVTETSTVDEAHRATFEHSVDETFGTFLFCAPVLYTTDAKWRASLLFSPMGKRSETEDHRFYMQLFVPAYIGFERFGHHVGRVVVRGLYGSDGRARSVSIVDGSGDQLLDDKSFDAMATAQLVFPEGKAPWTDPISVVRPFLYRH